MELRKNSSTKMKSSNTFKPQKKTKPDKSEQQETKSLFDNLLMPSLGSGLLSTPGKPSPYLEKCNLNN